MRPAICSTDSPVSRISRSCSVEVASSSVEVCSTCWVVSVTRATVLCTCGHQRAQFLHRVVHRVGDGAGDVFGHRGLLRQVAFGHRLQLVHQPQNGRLVGVVDALGFLLLALGLEALAFGELRRAWSGRRRTVAGCRHRRPAAAAPRRPSPPRAAHRQPPVAASCSCSVCRPLRSGSLSATITPCASRAATRPFRLARMAFDWACVGLVLLEQRRHALACLCAHAGVDSPRPARGRSSGPCPAGTPPRG